MAMRQIRTDIDSDTDTTHAPGVPAALRLAFSVYVALLIWTIVWKLGMPDFGGHGVRRIKLIPFVSSGYTGASVPLEVLANALLFAPFGVFLRLLAPAWPWWRAATALACASLGLESLQFILDVGISDTTDVIMNTAGGLVGFSVCAALGRSSGSRSLLVRLCSGGTLIASVVAVTWFVSPLQFGQPDVWVEHPSTPGHSHHQSG
ncbi:glycopeptide antibiotics resistance protein [Leucobacter luti]|uniref:Glycopeptide antibiotics resistance protein n=2 Tax=Leucobacter luti TaxID=340320 RepID=A0A4R6RRJ4_9MICO|nr:glycopeptide antibiotics resistance protein [Leucobacter luti]